MSHTPGPWKFKVVDETYSFLGCKRLDGGGGSTVIDLSNEWTGYPECGQDLQMTISKDDAALIEASRGVLTALEMVSSKLYYCDGDYYWYEATFTPGERDEIRAAIRKARGEA